MTSFRPTARSAYSTKCLTMTRLQATSTASAAAAQSKRTGEALRIERIKHGVAWNAPERRQSSSFSGKLGRLRRRWSVLDSTSTPNRSSCLWRQSGRRTVNSCRSAERRVCTCSSAVRINASNVYTLNVHSRRIHTARCRTSTQSHRVRCRRMRCIALRWRRHRTVRYGTAPTPDRNAPHPVWTKLNSRVFRYVMLIGRVSYIRIYLCYFFFRWKTVSLVQA